MDPVPFDLSGGRRAQKESSVANLFANVTEVGLGLVLADSF
jgi:hypothetical protein